MNTSLLPMDAISAQQASSLSCFSKDVIMDAYCATDPANIPSWWDRMWAMPFMAHGHCYLWRPEILWPNVIADALIAVSYYSIPVILLFFVRKRRDIPFHRLMVVFALFILACGTTHIIEIIDVWEPMYRLQAFVKTITAIVSVTAVAMLVPAIPQVLTLPSLAATNRDLLRTADELRRSNRDLENFAYAASHDLQEPLRMVTVNLDVLERRLGKTLPESAAKNLQFAREGSTRMHNLLNGLLAYAEIDGKSAMAPWTSPEGAVDEVLAQTASRLAEVGALVHRESLPAVPIHREHLDLVFTYLIENSLRFRRWDRPPSIAITPIATPERIGFRVADNGIGIQVEHREQVFRMFQRLHQRNRFDGIGVGLASVRKIAERNGGTAILVDGEVGGVACEVTFPKPQSATTTATA